MSSHTPSFQPPYRVVVGVKPRLFNDLLAYALHQDPYFTVVGQARRLSVLVDLIKTYDAHYAVIPLLEDARVTATLSHHLDPGTALTLIGISPDARTIQHLPDQPPQQQASLADLFKLMHTALPTISVLR